MMQQAVALKGLNYNNLKFTEKKNLGINFPCKPEAQRGGKQHFCFSCGTPVFRYARTVLRAKG